MAVECKYVFPIHPKDMFADKRCSKADERVLRCEMIKWISDLSQEFSQEDLDTKIFIDVDKKGSIIGLDFGVLTMGQTFSKATIPLGEMTAENWSTMHIKRKPT